MSNTGFVYPEVPPTSQKSPIVRVVETTVVRSLQKQSLASLEDDIEDDVLTDAYQNIVTEAAEQYLAKQLEEMTAKEGSDVDPQPPDPEVEQLLANVIDDDGEYVPEKKLLVTPSPLGEELMTSDLDDNVDDIDFDSEDDFDPVGAFAVEQKVQEVIKLADTIEAELREEQYVAKTNEANMKDEPYVAPARTGATKQAAEKGTLQYLKSVEGRVLTVLEAAFSSTEQREAVKSLIKKEFRREMNRVNRLPDED